MERKRTPGEHWDKEQWAPGAQEESGKDQDEVWNRTQVTTDRTEGDEPAEGVRKPDDPATAGEPSGHGQPSGESHWERNDPEA
jgi:hypothetical protein